MADNKLMPQCLVIQDIICTFSKNNFNPAFYPIPHLVGPVEVSLLEH